MSYVTNFISGLFGRFRKLDDGSVECTGLALEDNGSEVVKMMKESREETAVTRAAVQPITEDVLKATLVSLEGQYAAAVDRLDSPECARLAKDIGDLKRAFASRDSLPKNLRRASPDGFGPGYQPAPDVLKANDPPRTSYMNPGFATKACSECGGAFETKSARTR